jgi:hypothetical protein
MRLWDLFPGQFVQAFFQGFKVLAANSYACVTGSQQVEPTFGIIKKNKAIFERGLIQWQATMY